MGRGGEGSEGKSADVEAESGGERGRERLTVKAGADSALTRVMMADATVSGTRAYFMAGGVLRERAGKERAREEEGGGLRCVVALVVDLGSAAQLHPLLPHL